MILINYSNLYNTSFNIIKTKTKQNYQYYYIKVHQTTDKFALSKLIKSYFPTHKLLNLKLLTFSSKYKKYLVVLKFN